MGEIAFDKAVKPQMSALLQTIEKNDVGKVIIDAIKKTDKTLTFMPRTGGDVALRGDCNAETEAEGKDAAAAGTEIKVTRPGGRVGYDRGTGKGADTTIRFDPNAYTKACASRGPGSLADEIVLHEMVHAARKMRGIQFDKQVAGYPNSFIANHDDYDTEEEFLAIVVTNVYTSRAGRPLLRAGHRAHFILKSPLDTSAGFLKDPTHYQLMNIYRLVWSDVFTQMSVVQAPFNPFQELALNLGPVRDGTFKEPIYPEGKKPMVYWPRYRR